MRSLVLHRFAFAAFSMLAIVACGSEGKARPSETTSANGSDRGPIIEGRELADWRFVLRSLGDDERERVLRALRSRHAEVIPWLGRHIGSGTGEFLRMFQDLADGSPALYDALLNLSRSDDEIVRAKVAVTLGGPWAPWRSAFRTRASSRVVEMYSDSSPRVRKSVIVGIRHSSVDPATRAELLLRAVAIGESELVQLAALAMLEEGVLPWSNEAEDAIERLATHSQSSGVQGAASELLRSRRGAK